MNIEDYKELVKKYTPNEDKLLNALKAFISGGIIGLFSTFIYTLFLNSMDTTSATASTLIILIFLSSLFTGLGILDKLVEKFKCGIIIPITGFAHAMSSEALESKREGFITGFGACIFKLAGSVLLYGMVFSFVLVIIRVIFYG